MIKLLLSGKQLLLFIVIAGSLLVFVGYNVLTVEAAEEKDCSSISEPDDDFYCKEFDWGPFHPDKQFVEELRDASEDYAKNPKHCDKAYKLVEKAEEKAAKEDALCDNEDADTTDIKTCMSEDRLQQAAFNIGKEECKEANGDWKKDRCTYYEYEQQEQEDLERAQTESLPVIEDWGNTVSETDSIGQIYTTYNDDENESETNEQEIAEADEQVEEESDDSSEEEEPEQEEESEEDEPEKEDNSDSESEE